MQDLLSELLKENAISEKLGSGIGSIGNEKSEIGKQIKAQNAEDFANYQAMASGKINS